MSAIFHETMQSLEKSLTVKLISNQVIMLPFPENSSDGILDCSSKNGIDVIPLYVKDEGKEPKEWITKIAHVKENKKIEIRDVIADDLLSVECPVGDCIHLLNKRKFFLVLEKNRITRIVTVSDLNKLPVKVYISSLIHHLEGMMAERIQSEYPEDKWIDLLNENQQNKIENLYEAKMKDDFETNRIDCTTFVQKFTIMEKMNSILKEFNEPGKKAFRKKFEKIKKLRNRQEHNQDPVFVENDYLNIEKIRDQIAHNNSLNKNDVLWLSDTVNLIQAWIEILAGEGFDTAYFTN